MWLVRLDNIHGLRYNLDYTQLLGRLYQQERAKAEIEGR